MLRKIVVSVSNQILSLYQLNAEGEAEQLLSSYRVSTAEKGIGEKSGSNQTPCGELEICAKFGDGQPSGAVFKARVPTGEIFSPELAQQNPGKDFILSRILWLAGTEDGKNKGGDVDTQSRYIYIHGTSAEDTLGTPKSIGCVRMGNADIIELYPQVEVGTRVTINP